MQQPERRRWREKVSSEAGICGIWREPQATRKERLVADSRAMSSRFEISTQPWDRGVQGSGGVQGERKGM